MTYKRKTRDEWDVEQRTGYGWEVVTTEDNIADARMNRKLYAREQPQYLVRIVKRRVHLEEGEKKMVTMQDALTLARETNKTLRQLEEFHGMNLKDLGLQDLYDHADAFLKAAGEGQTK